MANAFAAAHDELAACQSAEYGEVCQAVIGEQTVPCVIYTNTMAEVFAPDGGGVVDGGGIMISVKKSLLTSFADEPNGEPPEYITPTIVRGINAFVLSVDERDGVFYILTGLPAAEG